MASKNPIIAAYNQGKRDQLLETRKEVLDWLEQEYLNPKVVRGTPIAEEILAIASKLSEMMKV